MSSRYKMHAQACKEHNKMNLSLIIIHAPTFGQAHQALLIQYQ
jgi:hypothetical protein